MDTSNSNGAAVAEAPEQTTEQAEGTGDQPVTPTPVSLDVPIRMLNTIRVAAKDNGRYAIDGVYVETRDELGLISVAATDGRRLIIAEWNRGLFDDEVHLLIPGMVARNAVHLATRPRGKDDEPMATIEQDGEDCTLTVFTTAGDVAFHWSTMELAFPPYRDVVPDWSDSTGLARIGIKPELFYGSLKALQEVVGDDKPVRFYLPNTPDRAIGLEAQDGDIMKALAVIMPVKIEEWTEQAVGGSQPGEIMPNPIQAVPEAWRSVLIADLTPALKAGKLKALEENTPPILTMGDMADWQASKGDWWIKDVKGFGPGGAEQYEEAAAAYWASHPQEQAKPAEAAAVLKWESTDSDTCDAENTAGIMVVADERPAAFWIEKTDDGFDVARSDSELMPDANPGDFDSLAAAKIWCELRNAQLVANAARPAEPTAEQTFQPADFDDDRLGETETVLGIERKVSICVNQRAGGRWASSWFASTIQHQNATKLEGHFASRADAITAAVDGLRSWITSMELTGKAAKQRDGILAELDKLHAAEMATA